MFQLHPLLEEGTVSRATWKMESPNIQSATKAIIEAQKIDPTCIIMGTKWIQQIAKMTPKELVEHVIDIQAISCKNEIEALYYKIEQAKNWLIKYKA